MPPSKLQRRQKQYFQLSSQLTQLDNPALHALFHDSETASSFGMNHTLDIAGSKVFVKRVPVTRIEYDNMFSTRNLYDLPTYYNYGFNSAGLGVFRELVAHVKTTNWVLDGSTSSFPLLYHYRIIPFTGTHTELDPHLLDRYVTYWGSNPNVSRYTQDRANAGHELVLFLEYFPHTVETWLLDNPARLPMVVEQARQAVTFLRNHGILHLDSHFSNMVTDGKQIYLTDFGLVLDKRFDLSLAEQQFFTLHSYYDYANVLWSLLSPLVLTYRALPDATRDLIFAKYGISPAAGFEAPILTLLDNLDDLKACGLLKLDKTLVAYLARYRSVIAFMSDFYLSMRKNDAKDTPFDHATLHRLLKQTGFVPDSTPSN